MPRKKKNIRKRGDAINLIVKSNELVEAKYMFDVWETRFFHTLVSMIDKNDEEEKEYRVWFKDVKKLFNIKSNQSYSLLREAARSLHRKPVYIGWMNDSFRRGREYNLFEFVDYLEAGQKGEGIERQEYVDIKIHTQMRPFLLHVKKNFDPKLTRYTSYELRNIEKLQPYGTRIYELFKQHEYKGYRELNIQDLKDRFLITNEYPRFSTLYQRVIMPSIKSINKHTDIYIPIDKIKKIKEGRRVVALYFVIESKSKKELAVMRGEIPKEQLELPMMTKNVTAELEVVENQADILFKKYESIVIKKFGVTPSVFLKMLESNNYDSSQIEQAISVTRRAKYNQEIKKNTAGFFMKALKEGYTDEKEEARKAQLNKAKELEQLEAQLYLQKDEFSKKVNDRIRALTAENPDLSEQTIKAITDNPLMEASLHSKEEAIGRPLTIEDYRQDEHLRMIVINNIIQMHPTQFEDIMNQYNDSIKQLEKEIKTIQNSLP